MQVGWGLKPGLSKTHAIPGSWKKKGKYEWGKNRGSVGNQLL